jgi:hypothetical protein
MKIILSSIIILLSLNCFSQDSSLIKISVVLTWKEVHYMGSFIYDNDEIFGDLADTVKVKIRGQSDPSEATSVTIISSIGTWLAVERRLRDDYVATSTANGNSSVWRKVDDALLLLTTQTYLQRKITEMNATDLSAYQSRKAYGKFKNRRQ